MTLSPAMLFLYATEDIKNKITNFFVVFGRVPLFYYFLHVAVIHALAILGVIIMGGDWHILILTSQTFMEQSLVGYGYSLTLVYGIWVGVVIAIYPLCKKYMMYKAANPHKWWLSYL